MYISFSRRIVPWNDLRSMKDKAKNKTENNKLQCHFQRRQPVIHQQLTAHGWDSVADDQRDDVVYLLACFVASIITHIDIRLLLVFSNAVKRKLG